MARGNRRNQRAPEWDTLYLSGGLASKGVGISAPMVFRRQLRDVEFQALSPRLCSLAFCLSGVRCKTAAVYFPTTWDSVGLVDVLYNSLSFLLAECRQQKHHVDYRRGLQCIRGRRKSCRSCGQAGRMRLRCQERSWRQNGYVGVRGRPEHPQSPCRQQREWAFLDMPTCV